MSIESTLNKVLYVEDDASIRLVTKLALEDVGGLTLKVCDSGREALACAEAFEPDLLLLDVMMPELDGPTTLRELRHLAATCDTPAVFMTAKVQPHEVDELMRLEGTIDIIPKPFDPMTLADQLREAWNRHQQQ